MGRIGQMRGTDMKHLPDIRGGTYYVTLSSSAARTLVDGIEDARAMEALVTDAVGRCKISIHAYCWLTRELHLVVDLLDGSLTSFVRTFAASFARSRNRRTNYSGALFAAGYGAMLIHPETHLLSLIRYLHLLPVYLGLVRYPADYPFSSHRIFLDPAASPRWISPCRALSLLSADFVIAASLYRGLVASPLTPADCGVFLPSCKRSALGPRDWTDSLCPTTPRIQATHCLESFVEERAAAFGLTIRALSSRTQTRQICRARALIAHAAIVEGVASLSELAKFFNRSPSSVYLAIQHYFPASNDG